MAKNLLKRTSEVNAAAFTSNNDDEFNSKKPKLDNNTLGSKVRDVDIFTKPSSTTLSDVPATLPEGFFDDPDLDAQARGFDRVKNLEQEYEEFKKLMQNEEIKSDVIVEKDDYNRDVDRDLAEVDELISRWSKIEDLHKQREALLALKKAKEGSALNTMNTEEAKSEKKNIITDHRKSKKKAEEDSDADDEEVDLNNVLNLDIRDKKRC